MQTELLQQEYVDVSQAAIRKIVDNIETVIIGKRESVELVVLAFIAQGHVLLEDLPGTGKTTLVSSMAKSVDCKFRRIQFTPDIMPSDVSGFSIFNQKTRDFEFRPGGVMSNLVLADEINRASAKTQAALLEAMEERQVTVDSNTYQLEEPFMVLATQNPIEQFGTYPLPEAQVDRFLIKLSMGYPAFDQEVEVIELGKSAKKAIKPVVSSDDILALRSLAERVHVSHMVVRYIVEIVTGTRNSPEVQVGSSPRGGIALTALTRAYALLQGRNYAIPDDVKYLAPYVLGHRITLSHEAKVQGRDEKDVIKSIISSIAVPYEEEDRPTGTVAPSAKSAASIDAQPTQPIGVANITGYANAPAPTSNSVDPQITQTIDASDNVVRSYRSPSAQDRRAVEDPIVAHKDDSHIFQQFENAKLDPSTLPAVSPLQETAEIPRVSLDDASESVVPAAQEEQAEQPEEDSAQELIYEESPSHDDKADKRSLHERVVEKHLDREAQAERFVAREEADSRRLEQEIISKEEMEEDERILPELDEDERLRGASRLNRATRQAKREAAPPMPSNDIAAQARASANEKKSFFGRRRKSKSNDRSTDYPISSNDSQAVNERSSERAATAAVLTPKLATEAGATIAKEAEIEPSASNKVVERQTHTSESSIDGAIVVPSTPDEVDVQAAFDAAFANLSFSSDDE